MMVWWKEYVLSVIGCALFWGTVCHLITDLRYKRLIQLISGTFLTLAVLGPLLSVDISDSFQFDVETFSPEHYVDLGKQAALEAQQRCIKESCESYISSKANEIGIEVTSGVQLNENMEPCFVQIYGNGDSQRQNRLEILLEEDLGITKENQVWIWNQEKGSSQLT